MSSSDDLYILIKSLTKTEKRHFKLTSSIQAGEKKYLKLFDAIAKQEHYDEKAIINQFEKERFIKNFSVAKAYLSESILNSLETFHSNTSIDGQLRKQISQIKILITKKHYKLCLKMIIKAKKNASDFDFFTYDYELSTLQDQVMQQLNEIGWLEKNHERLFKSEDITLEKLKNFQQYRKLVVKSIITGTKQDKLRDPKSFKKLTSKKKDKLLEYPSQALSERARISYYFLNGAYYYRINDYIKSIGYFIELKTFINSDDRLRKQYFHSLLYATNNIIATGTGMLSFKEIVQHLDELKNIRHRSQEENANVELRYFAHLSHIFIVYKKFNEFNAAIPEMEKWVKSNIKYKLHFPHVLDLSINISIIYFINRELKACLGHLNNILNSEEKEIAYDKYSFIRIFYLIVHAELKNSDLLPSLVRSTYRYYYKHKRLYKFETIVLDFIRKKLPDMSSKQTELTAYKELRSSLEKIIKDPNEKSALHNFDLISWLDSKIEGRLFGEVLSEKKN